MKNVWLWLFASLSLGLATLVFRGLILNPNAMLVFMFWLVALVPVLNSKS